MRRRNTLRLLAHAVIVLSVSLLVLFILDIYNPMLGFLDSPYSRTVLCVLLILAAALGVVIAAGDRRSR